MVDDLRVADAGVVTELRGLVEGSSARPADVYTSAALPGRDAALDVTIAAQDAVGAGDDCCATAFRGKIRKYAKLLVPLARDAVEDNSWREETTVIKRIPAETAER